MSDDLEGVQPIETSEVFEQDENMLVTEQEDGSALIDLPTDPEADPAAQEFGANLASILPNFDLNSVASNLADLAEKDKEARKKRDEQYEEGLKRTGLGDDAPGGATFSGASKVVHPLLAEGCVDFAARTIKELFPANGPVKTKILGEADRTRLERAKKKRDFLNWYLTEKMTEYRSEKEIMLSQLPLGGSQYEKFWFDPSVQRVRMEFVPIDKVLLPFSAASFYTSPRMTHMVELTRAEFEDRIKSGFYVDIHDNSTDALPEETSAEKANDKIEGLEESAYNEDGLRTVYEIQCMLELEGDPLTSGARAPYVVHLDYATDKICALYRNWEPSSETFDAVDWWVEDKFIPWRGVYGIGLPHLIGGLSGALTGALRALLDSAHINNAPTAIKLKGGRASGQNVEIAATEVREVDAPSNVDDIRKVIMPMPFNPPSAVLFQLLDWITNQAKGVVATAEEKIADASNQMPVGTALALIEQGSQVFSSIHGRLHEAQRRALKIICRLIRQNPDAHALDLQRFGLAPEDFNGMDGIDPVSDPRIFSEAQRFAQLQEQMKVVATFPEQPWNKNELARRSLELLRVDDVDSILPKPPQPVTEEPATENVAAMQGVMLKAALEQDHEAHIMTHLEFILSPIAQGAGPGVAPILQMLLNHIQEHATLAYQATLQAARVVVDKQYDSAGIPATPDQRSAAASKFALQQLQAKAQQLMPMMQQAQQLVASKAPPPPIEPAVQKTFEASMAQIQSNEKVAMARLEQEKVDSAQKDQLVVLELKQKADIEMIREENKKALAIMSEMNNKALEDLRQQTELLKNREDNAQHQHTELLKNMQDNQTSLILERMRKTLESAITPEPQQIQMQGLESFVQQLAQVASVMQGLQTSAAERQNRVDSLVQQLLGGDVGGIEQ